MATQAFASPAGRNLNMNSKVAVGNGKAMVPGPDKRQPMIGKQRDGTRSMPGSKGLGQAVTTVKSNPISGSQSPQKGNSAMGSGSVISGMV